MTTVVCPGLYCGRIQIDEEKLSDCGSCPRGFRRNDTSYICEACTDIPAFYDWLYLGFMVLLVLIFHWFFIDMVARRRMYVEMNVLCKVINTNIVFSLSKEMLILHGTAFIEVVLASLLSLLFSYPIGSFTIHSCKVRSIADWYTSLHNPTPNYEKKMHCTQEAVYPL